MDLKYKKWTFSQFGDVSLVVQADYITANLSRRLILLNKSIKGN